MTTTTTAEHATVPGFTQLSDTELRAAWCAGEIGLDSLEAECERRDRADRAHAATLARNAEWYDAAFAQYMAAEAETAGNLLSRLGLAEEISEPMQLWTGGEAWAMRRASEELRAFWDANGGRLSAAAYRAQQASQRRAWRDQRDLAAMPAPKPQTAPRPAPRPTVAPMSPGAIARFTAALETYTAQVDAMTARLSRTVTQAANGSRPQTAAMTDSIRATTGHAHTRPCGIDTFSRTVTSTNRADRR